MQAFFRLESTLVYRKTRVENAQIRVGKCLSAYIEDLLHKQQTIVESYRARLAYYRMYVDVRSRANVERLGEVVGDDDSDEANGEIEMVEDTNQERFRNKFTVDELFAFIWHQSWRRSIAGDMPMGLRGNAARILFK